MPSPSPQAGQGEATAEVAVTNGGHDGGQDQPRPRRRPPLQRGISRNKSDPKMLPVRSHANVLPSIQKYLMARPKIFSAILSAQKISTFYSFVCHFLLTYNKNLQMFESCNFFRLVCSTGRISAIHSLNETKPFYISPILEYTHDKMFLFIPKVYIDRETKIIVP